MKVAILVPTLNRPALIVPLAENVRDVTPPGAYSLVFVLDHADMASREAVKAAPSARYLLANGTYPQKINAGYRGTNDPLVLPTADDVVFHPGWYEAAAASFRDPVVQVVGTLDLSPATEDGSHATMPILRRSYCENPGAAWRETGTVFHEGYHHNYCETETWQLALNRGAARFVRESVIEHCHPAWGKREIDATDRKGNHVHIDADRDRFHRRQRQWTRALAA